MECVIVGQRQWVPLARPTGPSLLRSFTHVGQIDWARLISMGSQRKAMRKTGGWVRHGAALTHKP